MKMFKSLSKSLGIMKEHLLKSLKRVLAEMGRNEAMSMGYSLVK